MINLKELKAKAEAATQGQWSEEGDDCVVTLDVDNEVICCTSQLCVGDHKNSENLAFIAASNPATVIALIEALETVRVALIDIKNETLQVKLGNMHPDSKLMEHYADEALKELREVIE